MRIGFVVECGPSGADHKVIEHLVSRLRQGIEVRFMCSGSKRKLFDDCSKIVEGLFETDRCDHVFIVWDLVPCDERFRIKGTPCQRKEREHLLGKLRPQDVARTVMLCIRHELEAWLLADGAALTEVLQNKNHPKKSIGDEKRPEDHLNPKAALRRLFNERRGWDYDDQIHPAKIIKNASLSKLDRVPSFARFSQKLGALRPPSSKGTRPR